MPSWLAHTYAIAGIAISAIGAVLTVYYARRAKVAAEEATRAADAAKAAADAARARILNVDLLFEGAKVIGMIDELYDALGRSAWMLVIDRSNRISDRLISILAQTDGILTQEQRAELARANTQFRIVADSADEEQDRTAGDIRRFRKVVAEQKAAVILVVEALRSTARTENG